MNKLNNIWHQRKSSLLASINETMKKETVDKVTLEIMMELLNNIKIRKKSMEEYFDELD